MKVCLASDIMTTPVVTVRPEQLLTEATRLLLRHHISGLPVVDGDRLVGILTEHDVINFVHSGDAADTPVREAMTTEVFSLGPETPMETIISQLSSRRIRRIPIVDGGRLVGIVSRRDVLREMLQMYSAY